MAKAYTVTKGGHKLPHWTKIDDYRFALGSLCMAWSQLDHTLQETFKWLVGTDDETTAIITTGLERAEARATPIKRLAVHHGFEPQLVDFLTGLLNRVTIEIGPKRNRLIHDRWWLGGSGMYHVDRRAAVKSAQSRQAPTLQFNTEHSVSPQEIDLLTEYTNTVEAALWELNIQLGLWRDCAMTPRYDGRWSPACKPRTRLLRSQALGTAQTEWPLEADFHTD